MGCDPGECCNTSIGHLELHDLPEPIIHTLRIVAPETKQAFECYGDDSLTCCDFEYDVHVLAFGKLARRGSVDRALAKKLEGRRGEREYLLIDPLLCRPDSEPKRREPPPASSPNPATSASSTTHELR